MTHSDTYDDDVREVEKKPQPFSISKADSESSFRVQGLGFRRILKLGLGFKRVLKFSVGFRIQKGA